MLVAVDFSGWTAHCVALARRVAPHAHLLLGLRGADLAGGEAAIAQFAKAKALAGAAKLNLVINARISLVHACKPGDHAAVLKVLDEIIADNPAELTGELKQFRAQVAAAQAADKDKK